MIPVAIEPFSLVRSEPGDLLVNRFPPGPLGRPIGRLTTNPLFAGDSHGC